MLTIVDGAKLLIDIYVKERPTISLNSHPLLSELSNRSEENSQLRQNVIDIISSTTLKKSVRGVHSVEKKYMGDLMMRRKGKIDVDLAMEIIKEEMSKRLIFESSPGSKLIKVRLRDDLERE